MADSPLLSKELRDYMLNFKLEETISAAVNHVARQLPVDPYTFLAGFFGSITEEPPTITDVKARELLTENGPILEIRVEANSKGQTMDCPPFAFSPGLREEAYTLDTERFNGKGLLKAVESANAIRESLIGQDLTNQRKIDSTVESFDTGVNVKVSLSYACAIAASFCGRVPLYQHIFDKYTRRQWEPSPFPKILMPLLYGGKSNGSKVKFTCFYLYETSPDRFDAYGQYEAYKKLFETCKRILSSGKGGEAALKIVGSGFMPSGDTIVDSLKALEDIVTQSGFVMGEDFKVGIDCNAEDFFSRETLKYDMEGHKAPPDASQLVEYYVKLLSDKPYIGLLEDPFVIDDRQAWASLKERANETKVVAKRVAKTVEELKLLVEPEESEEPLVPILPDLVSINYTRLVSDVIDIGRDATKAQIGLTIGENPMETTDSSLVDLAIGMKAEFLQLGAPVKAGILSKYNRIIQLRS